MSDCNLRRMIPIMFNWITGKIYRCNWRLTIFSVGMMANISPHKFIKRRTIEYYFQFWIQISNNALEQFIILCGKRGQNLSTIHTSYKSIYNMQLYWLTIEYRDISGAITRNEKKTAQQISPYVLYLHVYVYVCRVLYNSGWSVNEYALCIYSYSNVFEFT